MPAEWAINGRFLSQPQTGVQRYARQILQALDTMLAENPELSRRFRIELLTPEGVEPPRLKAIPPYAVGTLSGHAWEQFVLPSYARGGLISLCNTGPVAKKRQILCVHDLNTRAYPQSYSRAFRLLYRTLIPTLVRRVAQVATVSHYSASEMRRNGLAPVGDIAVIPNGHEHTKVWVPDHTPATRAVASRDTIVLLGSNAAHKNVGLILNLADRLARHGFRIALAGSCDPNVFASRNEGNIAPNVVMLGRVADEALAALLQDSLCLAFPSFTEGFGLPPLEAMSLGCPVVSSDRASLPEVCGNAALYARPDDPDAWLNAFMRLRDEHGLRERMIEAGKAQALNFSWRASAMLYLERMAAIDAVSTTVPETAPAAIA
jgi:glycosyltransferase involved in cell wall biosynthesis